MSVIVLENQTYIGISYDVDYFTMLVTQKLPDGTLLVKEHVDLKISNDKLIEVGKELQKLAY